MTERSRPGPQVKHDRETGRLSASSHPDRLRKMLFQASGLVIVLLAGMAIAHPLMAQSINISLGGNGGEGAVNGGGVTDRAVQLIALITVLSLAPSILVMVTSFTRIAVVLSILRTAIGAQQSPPNSVIVSLALFLTAFVMAPVFEKAYQDGIEPLTRNEIKMSEAFTRASQPFKLFMLKHVREKDLQLFIDMAGQPAPQKRDEVSLRTLIPAFMISELRRAFEIGFLLFVPFLIIDMVVASVLMSMGMMMLPPVMISLPFKLIFFVLVDGWHLVAGSLVKSYLGS